MDEEINLIRRLEDQRDDQLLNWESSSEFEVTSPENYTNSPEIAHLDSAPSEG